MNRSKRILIGCLLALWGASAVYILFPAWAGKQSNVAHAQADILKVTTNKVGTDSIDVSYNQISKNGKQSTAYVIYRQPPTGGPTKLPFVDDHNQTQDYTTLLKINDKPDNGTWTYIVNAYETPADAGADRNSLAGGQSTTPITITRDVGGAAGTTSPLTGSCEQNEAAARGVADGAAAKIENQTIFQVISQDGVKSVFKWTLSLVNLLVLFFLLAVAFANILRFQVDTYAIQKVFTPLILGVLLANFSWLISRFFIEVSTILYHGLTDPYTYTLIDGTVVHNGAALFGLISERAYGLNHLCGTARESISSGFLGAFIGTALILVAGILILTLYALLVARVWVITLLIVLSPLAFLCLGFPMTQQYFKKWWTMFISWVFMAPASFLILVLAYQMAGIGTGPNLTKFIIVTALLYYAIQVPFKMGGEWMTKWGGYISQFKQKTGNLARTAADNSTKGIREGAAKNIKAAAWNTGLGQNVSAAIKRKQIKTGNLDDRLAAAQGRGATSFVDGPKGSRLLRDRGRFTERLKEQQDTLKLAEQKGTLDFYQSGDPEAIRINRRLGEIAEKQKANTDKLHHISEEGRIDFKRSPEGLLLNVEMAKLDREKTVLEEELKKLEGEAQQAFETTAEATHLTSEIAELQKKNLVIEKDVSNKQKRDTLHFAESVEGQRLAGKMKELGIEETTIDNFMAKAEATGAQDFLTNNPIRARQLVEGLMASGLEKDQAENLVKSVENELNVEYLDNTRGSSALRKARFGDEEIKSITQRLRSGLPLSTAEDAALRSRLAQAGITGGAANEAIRQLSINNAAGRDLNIAAEKAKLDTKLTSADIDQSNVTALGLAQKAEVENYITDSGRTVKQLETDYLNALRTTNKALIASTKLAFETAKISANQSSSIARAAVIASKDGLKEQEAENSSNFYKGEQGKVILDKQVYWGAHITAHNTMAAAAKDARVFQMHKPSNGVIQEEQLGLTLGLANDPATARTLLKTAIETTHVAAKTAQVEAKRAKREIDKGLDNTMFEAFRPQEHIERLTKAQDRKTIKEERIRTYDTELARFRTDLATATAAGNAALITELTDKITEYTTLRDTTNKKLQFDNDALAKARAAQVEYLNIIRSTYANKTEMPENIRANFDDSTGVINLVDLTINDPKYADALRAHAGITKRTKGKDVAAGRSITDISRELNGKGNDIRPFASRTAGAPPIPGEEVARAIMSGDYEKVEQYRRDYDIGTNDLVKINAFIDGCIESAQNYQSVDREEAHDTLIRQFSPDDVIEKIAKRYLLLPKGIPAVKTALEKAIAEHDPQAMRSAFSDVRLREDIRELFGVVRVVREENG